MCVIPYQWQRVRRGKNLAGTWLRWIWRSSNFANWFSSKTRSRYVHRHFRTQ